MKIHPILGINLMEFLKAKVKKNSAKTHSQIMWTWSFKGPVLFALAPLSPIECHIWATMWIKPSYSCGKGYSGTKLISPFQIIWHINKLHVMNVNQLCFFLFQGLSSFDRHGIWLQLLCISLVDTSVGRFLLGLKPTLQPSDHHFNLRRIMSMHE